MSVHNELTFHQDTRFFFVLFPNSVFLKLLRDWSCYFFICLRDHVNSHLCFSLHCSTLLRICLTNQWLPSLWNFSGFLQSSYCASVNTGRNWHLFLLEACFLFGFQATILFWLSSHFLSWSSSVVFVGSCSSAFPSAICCALGFVFGFPLTLVVPGFFFLCAICLRQIDHV